MCHDHDRQSVIGMLIFPFGKVGPGRSAARGISGCTTALAGCHEMVMRSVDNARSVVTLEEAATMRHSESELEQVIAAARGIPVPPPRLPDATPGRRLASAARWLRFWHERAAAASGLGAISTADRADRSADS